MSIPMIAGLYSYVRGGVASMADVTLKEIPQSIEINPLYKKALYVLAGNQESAAQLAGFNLNVYRIFDDAPEYVQQNMAHMMKHWMCLWALKEFGEFLWVDWDTVMLQFPDKAFTDMCRKNRTPKFIRIPNYWATVNCGVYYACHEWISAMESSFKVKVDPPNDDLLWAEVLPADVLDREEFWLDDYAVHIGSKRDIGAVTDKTYFAHVKNLEWAEQLRNIQK